MGSDDSCCDQLRSALCGVAVGFVLLAAALILLAYNEFNYVWNRQLLMDLNDMVIDVACVPDSSNNRKLVWVSCPITKLYNFTQDTRLYHFQELIDASDLNSAWVKIATEMYAWHEEQICENQDDGHGGSTQVCSFSYHKQWSSEVPVSSKFNCALTKSCQINGESIINSRPYIPKILEQEIDAPDNEVSIGQSFGLNEDMVLQLTSAQPLKFNMQDLTPVSYSGIVPGAKWVTSRGAGVLRFAQDKDHDKVGDFQAAFTKFQLPEEESTLSAIGQQSSTSSLVAWHPDHYGTMSTVNWIVEGVLSKKGFLELKDNENKNDTWIIRLAGWLLAWFALQLITWPVALAPQVIPCLGQCIGEVVGCALFVVNFALSVSVTLLAAGFAWMMARPWLGVVLMIIGLLFTVGALLLSRSVRNKNGARRFDSNELGSDSVELAAFQPQPSSRFKPQPTSKSQASTFLAPPSSRYQAQSSSRFGTQSSSRF